MYEAQKNRLLKHIDFLILDVVVLEILLFVLSNTCVSERQRLKLSAYHNMYYVAIIVSVLIFLIYEEHKLILRRGPWKEFTETCKFMTILFIGMLSYFYLTKTIAGFSRKFFILFWAFGCVTITVARLCYKHFLVIYLKKSKTKPRVILITDNPKPLKLVRAIEKAGLRCAFDSTFLDAAENPVGRQLEEYRKNTPVDEAVIALHSDKRRQEWIDYFLLSGIPVHVSIEQNNILPNAEIGYFGDLPVITSSKSVANPLQLLLKRCMDIAGALVGLFLTGIAYCIFAPIIKKQSPGPVFYSQVRIGKNGRQFKIHKFRSMYPDADKRKADLMKDNKMDGLMFKVEDDPRIIPIGHFIRKYSIDELPQFWNVLKGEMSLVGTRPPTLDEWEHYSAHHRARLGMKPGITGMWQVSGRNNITDFEKIVRMDVEYIEKWNLNLDIKLLLKTVIVVFKGDGAV